MPQTETNRRKLIITLESDIDPLVGRYLWMVIDTRKVTLEALSGLEDRVLNWTPPNGGHAIGTLLYHLVVIELDWLYVEILEEPTYGKAIGDLLPYPDRNGENQLTAVTHETLETHLARLRTSHEQLCNTLRRMTAEDFGRARHLDHYDVTPEWVIHHLIQHEVEHRGEILELRRRAELSDQTS